MSCRRAARGLARSGWNHWGVPAGWALVAAAAVLTPLVMRTGGNQTGRLQGDARFSAASVDGTARGAGRCDTCHSFDPMFSHPVGVLASGKASTELPLEHGRLTCATCHDEAALEGHERLGRRGDAALRGDMPVPSLCAQCHEPGTTGIGGAASGAHASGVQRAHLSRGSKVAAMGEGERLDRESTSCMTCHDGSSASDAGSHSTSRMGRGFSPEQEHPVGVAYSSRRAAKGSEPIELVGVRQLDKRIRLFDGRVGCGSCHSVYSTQKKLTVMPMLRSQLCFGCHIE